jgi:hypothetical protein
MSSVNMVFDGADVAELYDCKAAPAPAPPEVKR